ncbi:MAG: hypothetical protein CMK09_02380 [Ponticaulis sp.]|nr:hypothetical protein [Ponticaulis sp.]|tara:strand:+ start:29297 stop:31003 length:1707 start_codon:yes stop_codon:yes gene_type:complete
MSIRLACLSLLAFFGVLAASADERIHSFDVAIEVETDGDILVTETITVTAEGQEIRRGIFRELPRYYKDDHDDTYRYDYDVKRITRNGKKEPWVVQKNGNAYTIRIGDEDVFLPRGTRQTYEITYHVGNQIRYFETHDELYWNVTGTYWAFPIDAASARIILPDGAGVTDLQGYTGRYGQSGRNATAQQSGQEIVFETTEPLARREGLTVSVSLQKGVIDPPSLGDKFGLLWQKYFGLGILGLTLLGVFFFYYRSWQTVGQDAAKLPTFPHYEPPSDISPAAAHMIYYRNYKGNEAFTASLVDLAVKGYLNLKTEKKKVTLTKETPTNSSRIAAHQHTLYNSLLTSQSERTFGEKYDSSFAESYKAFKSDITREYGAPYFRWNTAYIIIAAIFCVIAFIIAIGSTITWTSWHSLGVLALILVNLAFMYFMPARTPKGAKARSAVAGLRLYLETAEKAQMNMADVHGNQPPAMSKDRYEQLLPYAIALNVEKPWTKYFEKVLPTEAQAYNPGWSSGHFMGHSLHSATRSMESAITSGVATASVAPSSSSGSRGGGFSGGGGGGGGGGGW